MFMTAEDFYILKVRDDLEQITKAFSHRPKEWDEWKKSKKPLRIVNDARVVCDMPSFDELMKDSFVADPIKKYLSPRWGWLPIWKIYRSFSTFRLYWSGPNHNYSDTAQGWIKTQDQIGVSQETIDILRDIDTVIDIRQVSDKRKKDLRMVANSNIAYDKSPRTERQIEEDTARGYAVEFAIEDALGSKYIPFAPVVENPLRDLTYEQRKTDAIIDGYKVEIKSMKESVVDLCPLTKAQKKSIDLSIPLNDFFIIGGTELVSDWTWRVRLSYLIDAKELPRFIVPCDMEHSKERIDTRRLLKYNKAIDLRKDV